MQSYDAAIAWLDRFQFHGFRLGLERMEAILEELGHPEKAYPAIHVAGTNGKGSVCAMLESVIGKSGLKCGFYSSPHLFLLNERFRADGCNIGDDDLARLVFMIKELVLSGFELSYFEYTTVMAMIWFMEQGVDVALFETGLGGRLDATNVIMPECSVITTVALDHQAWLGNTVQEIAYEKAGIVKRNIPVVCGVREPDALEIINERALAQDSRMFLLDRDFRVMKGRDGAEYHGMMNDRIPVTPGLPGLHQLDNMAVAIAAWEIFCARRNISFSPDAVKSGISDVVWPGRGEILCEEPFVIADGAHNMAGVEALISLLSGFIETGGLSPEQGVLVWACSDEGGDKDFVAMAARLMCCFGHMVITEPPGPRKPVTVDMWKERAPEGWNVIFEPDWRTAIDNALDKTVTAPSGWVCIAGSLYLVGAARHHVLKG